MEKLVVREADKNDVGHTIARIDSSTMKELNIADGDLVILTGTRATAVTARMSKTSGHGIIQADGLVRRNAGVALGEHVRVDPASNVQDATRVMLAPTDVKLSVDREFVDYVKRKFSNRVLAKGDLLLLAIFGSAVPMVVIRMHPQADFLRLVDLTDVTVLPEPFEEMEKKRKTRLPLTIDMKFLFRHDWLRIVSSRIDSERITFSISQLEKEDQSENRILEEARQYVEKEWQPADIAVNFYSPKGDLIGSLPWLSIDQTGNIKAVYPEAQLPVYPRYQQMSPLPEIASSSLMRRCFKIGLEKCPKEISLSPRTVFVATPFKTDFQDYYKYAIRPALEEMGFQIWKADEHIDNIDIMCKMCQAIQQCSHVVANISDWNANVLFEIGLAYGIGKKVIMVKNVKESVPVDLSGLEYIDYEGIDDLKRNLMAFFKGVSPA